MNIHLQDVHVTLVISPTDLRCGYHRLHSIAQDQLGINLNGGKHFSRGYDLRIQDAASGRISHLHPVSYERRRHMNIRFSGVHVTLVISSTDLRGGFHRLCTAAQDQLGINLSSGKEAVVFLSKTRKICKIVTTDEKGTMLLTRTLHNGRFEELMVRVGQQAKCSLTLSDLERFLNGKRLYTKSDTFW